MSLFFESSSHRKTAEALSAATGSRKPMIGGSAIKLALVNNMPDSALIATERQFVRLASEAFDGGIEISLFHLPGLQRGDDARAILSQRYAPIAKMLDSEFDALIVTGNEPRAPRLDQEPYWQELVDVIEWSQNHVKTSIWSCLAAHAAVLHLDGIERRRLPQKKSGVLTCSAKDQGLHGLPQTLFVCHSRMNGIDKSDLEMNGYDILSEAPGEHIDIFAKSIGSRFVFLQGHPEYDADSLMREYRRDTGRYLNGVRDTYPDVPEGYFDSETTVRMENYRNLAERHRDIRLFESFPKANLRAGLATRLAQSAQSIFRSWTASLANSGAPA